MTETTNAIGYFIEADRDRFLQAVDAAAASKRVVDAYTPYPVHGIEHKLGYAPSWIGRAVLGTVLLGFAVVWAAIWQDHVMTWPINVSGKPYESWALFVVPTMEAGLLFGALVNFLACFHACKLGPPGIVGHAFHKRRKDLTDDHFALVVSGDDAVAFLQAQGAKDVEVCRG